MLVLSRKSQQSIRIGDSITVTVVRVKGNTVRIGIEAPEDVRIMRGELVEFVPAGDDAPSDAVAEEAKPYEVQHFRIRRGETTNPQPSQSPESRLQPQPVPPIIQARIASALNASRPR